MLPRALVKKAADAAKRAVEQTLNAHTTKRSVATKPQMLSPKDDVSIYEKRQRLGPFSASTIADALRIGVETGVMTRREAKEMRERLARFKDQKRALAAIKGDLAMHGVCWK